MFESQARTELVADLFVRGLGLVYAIAFASLGVQVIGLIGAHGIDPAAEMLAHAGDDARNMPTWLWLTGASDSALRLFCIAGVLSSLLILARRVPRIALFAAWSIYLSLCTVGGAFLSYQWDTLLLECGLVGLFVATPGSRAGVWLARALCLKLMLLSGLAKLRSGDPTWRDLTALSFHLWTQPLPAWPAVFVDQLPAWVHKAMTCACLAIELAVPPLIFAPRRVRLAAAALLALLQVVIAATGSYGFFNLLSLLLCASLLDDQALLAAMPARLRPALERYAVRRVEYTQRATRVRFARERRWAHVGFAAVVLLLSATAALQRNVPLPRPVLELLAQLAPLRSINRYGLFAVMTVQRLEIGLEGSSDGVHWRAYEFAWKPDRLDERPRFVTPHMPRLDWQMWFAALSRCERQDWLLSLMKRVLEGSPDVLGLFERDPFPQGPPRFVRTPVAKYRFAPGFAWLHGRWWASEPIGEYCPRATLRDGELVPAR